MAARIETVFGRNITIAYDALDLQTLDRNMLREIIPGLPPTVMDMPDMLVAVYPPLPWVIQVGDHRIRVNIAVEMEGLGDFPIWEYAIQAQKILPAGKSPLIAYGYNFDFGVRFDGITSQTGVISKFVPNRSALEEELQGNLVSYLPRLIFTSGKVQYDIVFEPMNDVRMKIHGNAHIQYPGIQAPSSEELKTSYILEFERLQNTISKLLQE